MSNDALRPVIVVTGANSGVGFGICQRLLFQLCTGFPTDALPQKFVGNPSSTFEPSKCDGLTIVMACRSMARAEAARIQLFKLLDGFISSLQKQNGRDRYARHFRQNVVIDIVPVDLGDIASVFKFAEEVSIQYRYISCLICNAGIVPFSHLDWFAAIKQFLREPMMAVTAPVYYFQHKGQISKDGFGQVWQANFFGHYVLYRSIEHLLLASPPDHGSRVIWMSSLEASPVFYDSEDWQLMRTDHSYESSKYQMDLVGTLLDRRALHSLQPHPTRHFLAHPGVCSTNISNALIGPITNFLKIITLYIARLCGSPNHPVDPYKAAISAVHLVLTSLAFITLWPVAKNNDKDVPPPGQPAKFSAETNRWGTERVGLTPIKDWDKQKIEGELLLVKCEALYQRFRDGGGIRKN